MSETEQANETKVLAEFEKWVTAMEPAYADSNLERLTGGRGSYRVHNVACWWMAWQAAYAVGMARMREMAAKRTEQFAEDIHYENADAKDVAEAIRALPTTPGRGEKK